MNRIIQIICCIVLFTSCSMDYNKIRSSIYKPKINNTIYGIYLPQQYIAQLKLSKSHVLSLNKVNSHASAIVMQKNTIHYLYNYHEGTNPSYIIDADGNIKCHDTSDGLKYTSNGQLVDVDGYIYVKISNKMTDDENEIEKYVNTILFNDSVYYSGNNFLYCNNGIIYLNKAKYKLSLNTIFVSTIHDYIYNKKNDPVKYFV